MRAVGRHAGEAALGLLALGGRAWETKQSCFVLVEKNRMIRYRHFSYTNRFSKEDETGLFRLPGMSIHALAVA